MFEVVQSLYEAPRRVIYRFRIKADIGFRMTQTLWWNERYIERESAREKKHERGREREQERKQKREGELWRDGVRERDRKRERARERAWGRARECERAKERKRKEERETGCFTLTISTHSLSFSCVFTRSPSLFSSSPTILSFPLPSFLNLLYLP